MEEQSEVDNTGASVTQVQVYNMETFQKLKLDDYNQKLNIVKYMLWKCVNQDNKMKEITFKTAFDKVNYYTGVNVGILKKLQTPVRITKTFDEWADKANNLQMNHDNFEIREILMEYYLMKHTIPRMMSLRNDILKEHPNISDDVLKYKLNSFVWQRLPGTKKAILIENPKSVHNRHRYLQEMRRLRETDRNIIYVGERFFKCGNETNTYNLCVWIAVSNKIGLIEKKIACPLNVDEMKSWVIDTVLCHLSEPSIIVLSINRKDSKNISSTPTINSKKCEMINWLQTYNIPHDPEYHRSELYNLIKKSKLDCNKTHDKFEEILKAHGHAILHWDDYRLLNYFYGLWIKISDIIVNETDPVSRVNNFIDGITTEEWRQVDAVLKLKENKVYKDDVAMETVIDKLVTFAKYKGLQAEDELECDEEFDDEYLSEHLVI